MGHHSEGFINDFYTISYRFYGLGYHCLLPSLNNVTVVYKASERVLVLFLLIFLINSFDVVRDLTSLKLVRVLYLSMYELLRHNHRGYKIIALITVDFDEYVGTYCEEIIKDELILQLVKGSDRWKAQKVNVKSDNIDRFIEDIKDCKYQFTTKNGDKINLNSLGVEKSEIIGQIRTVKDYIEEVSVFDIPINNSVLMNKEDIEGDRGFAVLSEGSSYNKVIIFGGLPISLNLVTESEFDFQEHLEETNGFITCQYCGKCENIDAYYVNGSGGASFDRPNSEICNQCAEKITQKCNEIFQNKEVVGKIIAQEI